MTGKQRLDLRDFLYNILLPHFKAAQQTQDPARELSAGCEKLVDLIDRVYKPKMHNTKETDDTSS